MEYNKDLSFSSTGTKTVHVSSLIIPFNDTRTGYHVLAGAFPCNFRRGNQHILILYDYDGNGILERAIKNNQADAIRNDWQFLHNILKGKGNDPNL